MTVEQKRLIRSINLKVMALTDAYMQQRRDFLTELLLIQHVYGSGDCGLTFELALSDIYERVKELEQQQQELAA